MGQLEPHTELETADCFTRRNRRSDLNSHSCDCEPAQSVRPGGPGH